ncbi:MAG TPA: DUF4405 domain-containing protein [Phycisphaerae bacterium]|nr:DUF4405 domain-containing protein [Phycisphaerae bacterium]
MRRATLNLIIDVISFAILASMIATGLLVRFVLPPGSRGGRGLSLWNLDRHDWGDIHFGLAASLIGVLLIHLALHWSWVCQVARIAFGAPAHAPVSSVGVRRTVIGLGVVAGLTVLIAALLFFASANVSHLGPGHVALDEPGKEPILQPFLGQDTTSTAKQHHRRHRGSQQP